MRYQALNKRCCCPVKKKTVLIALVVLVSIFWFSAHYITQPEPKVTKQNLPSPTPELEAELELVKSLIEENKGEHDINNIEEEINLYEDEVFRGQVKLIADQYENTAKFPVGSQPIRNLADARQPEPFEETEVETPLETETGETIRVSAAVDKFQYYTNEIINLRLIIDGITDDEFVSAKATISGAEGDTGLTSELQASGATQRLLTTSFDTSIAPPNTLLTEMIIKVEADIGGQPFFTTVSFNYSNASAQLTGLGLVQPNGPNLDIPLEYNVFIRGYYFVSAILRDKQTNKPLISLQTEGRMSQGNGQLIAQAHIKALKETGSEGPYIVSNIKAYRGAEQGEQFDIPASTVQQQYEVSKYPFSLYQDEEHKDPLAEERVEFLKKLGQIDINKTTEKEVTN